MMKFRVVFLHFVIFILVIVYEGSSKEHFDNKVIVKRSRIERPPVIKMMKRRLKNFVHGQAASITLVFYSTRDVYIRWFKRDRDQQFHLEGSEVPNFFPIDGDDDYEITYLVAGHVIAATIKVLQFAAEFPVEFETIITTQDGVLQYNIRTRIENEIPVTQTDKIDSPEWDRRPPDVNFELGGFFQVACQVFIPGELKEENKKLNHMNTLVLNRAIGTSALDANLHGNENILNIIGNADRNQFSNISEQRANDPTIMSGYRKPFKFGHVLYEAKITTTNASAELEGIYQCIMERWLEGVMLDGPFEKSYAIGHALIKGHISPYVSSPEGWRVRVTLKPCDNTMLTNGTKKLVMRRGQKACIRCSGIGYPRPEIMLIKDQAPIHTRSDVTAIKSINVADAGISEMTYVFHDPTAELDGMYNCTGENEEGRSNFVFNITVVG